MYFHLLGTAAGGGVPQWNCACENCLAARGGGAVSPRLQMQAAFSADGRSWYLLNASPDLRQQIETHPFLQPRAQEGRRNTPIKGIVLTGADLDQTLGLLLLREFQPLTVYATRAVREALEPNSFFRMLERAPRQLQWIEIRGGEEFRLGANQEIVCTPIAFSSAMPHYAGGVHGEGCLGLILDDSKLRIAYSPALPKVAPEIVRAFDYCDYIFVDGTFWSDAELNQVQDGAPLARTMAHTPISGEEGTMELLKSVTRPQRYFVHINNTNPILNEHSAERAKVLAAGWQVGVDPWQVSNLNPPPQ